MSNTMSKPGLDPIEHASIDELRALQLERLKWTLKHAYDNVPHYKKAFDEAGVHPDDLKQLSDISKFPSPRRRNCARTIRSACSPCARAYLAHPRIQRHHWQADRGGLHQGRPG